MPWNKLTKSFATSEATISDMDGETLEFMGGGDIEFMSGKTWTTMSRASDSWITIPRASD